MTLDGVELVEGDGGLGPAFGDALDESRAHVDADLHDRRGVAAMRGKVIGKCGNGGGILALGANSTLAWAISTNSVMSSWPRRAAVSSMATRVTAAASVRA